MEDYSLVNEKKRLINRSATLLCEHMTELFNDGYEQGYKDGRADKPCIDTEEVEEKAYNRGLAEAWEAARKIHDGQIPYEVFGLDKTGNGFTYASPLNWGETITAQEAIDKIKAYEEKQDTEIKVGDEVKDDVYGHIGVVITDKPTTYDQISVWFPYYSHVQLVAISNLIKTNRHFSKIAEALEELRGIENEHVDKM